MDGTVYKVRRRRRRMKENGERKYVFTHKINIQCNLEEKALMERTEMLKRRRGRTLSTAAFTSDLVP